MKPTAESGSSSDSDSDSSSSSSSSSDSEPEKAVRKVQAKPSKPAPSKVQQPKVVKPLKKPVNVESSSESDSSSEEENFKPRQTVKKSQKAAPPAPVKSNLDLLLDLEEVPPSVATPTLTPSLGGLLTPGPATPSPAQPMYVSTAAAELLNKVTTGGVAVMSRFTRHPHLYAPRMVAIELTFTNCSSEEVAVIKLGSKSLSPGMSMHEFPAVSNIGPDQARTVTLGVDYKD